MSNFIFSEKQIRLIIENFNKKNDYLDTEVKWNKLTKDEKEFVFEFLKQTQNKEIIIKEAWYNTLGDIVGIFDPTGIVDLVNGISYIKQGDLLFGFLSVVSAVPYIGDFVAKPVMGALKIGSPSAKALQGVLKTAKAGKTAEAAADLAKLTDVGGITGKFAKGMKRVSPKLKEIINKLPDSTFKGGGIKKTLLQWIELFEQGAKRGVRTRVVGANLAKRFKKLTPDQSIQKLEELIKLSKNTKGIFSGYRTNKGVFSAKTLFGGMPQLIGRNKSIRSLMRQTKWYFGLLDFLGFGNFVGPDELIEELGGVDKMVSQIEEYNRTPESSKYFEEDFGEAFRGYNSDSNLSSSNTKKISYDDPFGSFLTSLL